MADGFPGQYHLYLPTYHVSYHAVSLTDLVVFSYPQIRPNVELYRTVNHQYPKFATSGF